MSDNKLNVSSNPHVRDSISTSKIMLLVIIGLMPTSIYGVYHFGLKALLILVVSIVSAVLTESIFNAIVHKNSTVYDLSAVVTGLLLGLNLPVSVPLWLPVIGSVFAIVFVKCIFGGLGQNFMNPALGARCFLIISFPKLMTDFAYNVRGTADAISGATPLMSIRNNEPVALKDMIMGNTAGTIGETSMFWIVIGACILIWFGIIDVAIPFSYIISFGILVLVFSGRGLDINYMYCQLAGGGLMLGAFFMATDYVTRPITLKGQIIYGIFLGFLTAIFRVFGPSAEGVSYAIIIGNLLVPLIDKITIPTPFGVKKAKGGDVK